jgi:hypothetical protein
MLLKSLEVSDRHGAELLSHTIHVASCDFMPGGISVLNCLINVIVLPELSWCHSILPFCGLHSLSESSSQVVSLESSSDAFIHRFQESSGIGGQVHHLHFGRVIIQERMIRGIIYRQQEHEGQVFLLQYFLPQLQSDGKPIFENGLSYPGLKVRPRHNKQ